MINIKSREFDWENISLSYERVVIDVTSQLTFYFYFFIIHQS